MVTIFILLLAFGPPLAIGVWMAEQYAWELVPPNFHWLYIWLQVVLVGALLGWLAFYKVIIPVQKRRAAAKIKNEITKQEHDYKARGGVPCILFSAAGSITRAVWENLIVMAPGIREQRVKILLLLAAEDLENAKKELGRALGLLAQGAMAAVKLIPVTAGTVSDTVAESIRDTEAKTVRPEIIEWTDAELKGVRLCVQLVGIPGENNKGFTSGSCFRKHPEQALRRPNGGAKVPRWVFFLRDRIPEILEEVTEEEPTGEGDEEKNSDERESTLLKTEVEQSLNNEPALSAAIPAGELQEISGNGRRQKS